MFLLNSRLSLFSAAPEGALLLPKLRSYFAEFLNNTSPAHLRILSLPACVGLRYGRHLGSIEAFPDSVNPQLPYLFFVPHHGSALWKGISLLPRPCRLARVDQRPGLLFLLCHSFSQSPGGGTGISTGCPSPTPSGLGLGPDLP